MTVEREYVVPTLLNRQDHPHHDYDPLNQDRLRITWPDGAPVAVCVIVVLEHLEWFEPEDGFVSPSLAGGYGRRPHPDITMWSHREYGHRVGIFRLLDALRQYGVRPTVAIDALTAQHYPALVQHCDEAGAEFVAHGWSVSRMVTDAMTGAAERSYIDRSVEAVRAATRSDVVGWFGPEYGESRRTPSLLAEAGMRYVCDWVNDEQPYRMTTPSGELYSLPVSYPLDDADALWDRRLKIGDWVRIACESFDQLALDGMSNGRLLTLVLRPWLTGQAFRAGCVSDILGHISSSGNAWFATGGQIVDSYRAQTLPSPRQPSGKKS
jgi:peptidoglycan/xylan/chitin deacetylase (PgdA/CDA1 family)